MEELQLDSKEDVWIRMKNLEAEKDEKGRDTEIVFWKVGSEEALVAQVSDGSFDIFEMESEDAEPSLVKELDEESRDDWKALEELTKEIYSRGGTIVVQDAIDLKQVDVVQKAKLLRRELSLRFPDQKFSVKTDRYTGGSSINVSWEDGVAEEDVKEVVDMYQYTYPDEDIQSDYFHSDNHAFVKRSISDEAKEEVASEILDEFAEDVFEDRHWRDQRFKTEYLQRVKKTSFSERSEASELEA